MLRIVWGLFFIAHGLVHAFLAVAPNPADPDSKPGAFFTTLERSWLLSRLGVSASAAKWIGMILVVLSTLGFALSGLGIFGLAGLSSIWHTLAILSACFSLLLLVIYWHPWLPVGLLIDIAVLVTLLWLKWPPLDMIGS